MVGLVLATFALVVALSYPGAAVMALAVALVAWPVVRTLRRRRQARREEERTRQVCVPNTDVCIET